MATSAETESKSEGSSSSKPPNSRTSTSSSSRLVEKLSRITPSSSPKLNGIVAPTADSASERSPGASTKQSPVLGAQLSKQSSPVELPAPVIQAPVPQKPKNSLQRMFSRTGKKESLDVTPIHTNASTPVNGERPSTDRQTNGTDKKSDLRGPLKKNSISEESTKAVTNSKTKDALKRFEGLPDGGHIHQLKSAKRQERLSDMLRDLILGKRKDDLPESDNLNLVSSWVEQIKNDKDKLATDKKGGPSSTSTLVEKYGKCQEVVGRGAFGIVRISHKADPNHEGKEQLYAVKEFRRRPQESAKRYNKRLTSEFCISSSLRHPNVIHTLDLLQDAKGDYCEVMEYCAGGDLYTLILSAGKLDCAEADCYFKQLMRGVEYMHEMGVAHRDLKPENLLLTSRGALKITDFGNGECFRMAWEKEAHKTCGLCGSAPYISPEEYIEKEFDPRAVDVWATGVIYMAMRTGRHLWRVAKRDEDEFFQKYLEGRKDEAGYGPIESLHRARCRNVIYSILDPNPTRRITASQVLKSEWGREIKVCQAGEEGDNPSVRNHQPHSSSTAAPTDDALNTKQVKA
ncbi:serine/threonine-protein kinase HAL4/sat4 [Orbilia oligospora]|uniref:non-specific serine/threonine protein kinase n=1 Tax=Orbilia oligospora TaxID=2813651 RepID=A0A7C8P484_ORBOL|nr:serine/threonine-protein kinase HAL4/sat4 [Orbilia oligospora]KAF3298546.1 serine/threonine-protein kinase HAL4/sat4 [Orbilia oligospora]TGJ73213.1 serine/threonine-protein kinase HAL4/sat4 [Orbilia oligospora]